MTSTDTLYILKDLLNRMTIPEEETLPESILTRSTTTRLNSLPSIQEIEMRDTALLMSGLSSLDNTLIEEYTMIEQSEVLTLQEELSTKPTL